MKYSTYNINSPSPYSLLHKDDLTPNVLSVGLSDSTSINSIEADIKILTAHKTNAASLITKISFKNGRDLVVPEDYLCQNFNSLPTIAAIKIGNLTESTIDLLNKRIRNISIPIIVSACELDPTTYNSMKDTIFNRSRLFVCNSLKAQELATISTPLQCLQDAFNVASILSEDTSIPNILITDCVVDNKKTVDVLYHCYNQEFTVFTSSIPLNAGASPIATAIASNLAHNFSLKESVYGALEYVHNTLLLRDNNNKSFNFTYTLETPLTHMLEDECFTAKDLITIPKLLKPENIVDNFFKYLIQHPLVKPYWDAYVNHDFVKHIADGTLPLKKFQFFIEQDYSYLVDYGRVHCIAASKAPNLEGMEKELLIVGRIRDGVVQHKKRLKEEFGVIDENYFKKIRRGPALNNYCRYFNDIARRGNFQELAISLTPCLFGYGEAVKKHANRFNSSKGGLYAEWMNTFTSENFKSDMEAGVSLLNDIVATCPTRDLEKLVRIYGEVCNLETKFWDAALVYE